MLSRAPAHRVLWAAHEYSCGAAIKRTVEIRVLACGRILFERGKVQRDRCALLHCTFNRDATAVQLHDGLHDSQPQARSVRALRACGVGAIEAVEEARQMFRRDAAAGVAHADESAAVAFRLDVKNDFAASG